MAAIVIGMAYLVNALVIKKDKVNLVNVARFGGAVSPAIGTALLVRFINGFVHVSGINGTILAGLYFAALVVALLQSLEIIRGMVSEKNIDRNDQGRVFLQGNLRLQDLQQE